MSDVKIKKLNLTLGKRQILKDINLDIASGEIITIIGANGSGKSSLVKSMLNIYNDYSGMIELAGRSNRLYSNRELAKICSYVPQNISIDAPIKVKDFIELAQYPYQGANQTVAGPKWVDYAIESTNIDNIQEQFINTLSGGELQKVLIAAAITQSRDTIILDEPLSFLDPKTQIELFNILRELNRREKTTIIEVCHDLNYAVKGSDRLVALKDGAIVYNDTADNLLQNDQKLADIYGVNFNIFKLPNSSYGVFPTTEKGKSDE